MKTLDSLTDKVTDFMASLASLPLARPERVQLDNRQTTLTLMHLISAFIAVSHSHAALTETALWCTALVRLIAPPSHQMDRIVNGDLPVPSLATWAILSARHRSI